MNKQATEQDLLIKRDIITELKNEINLKNCLAAIKVRVRDGNVTLMGMTNNFTAKILIYKIALQVPGVREVDDHIEVRYGNKRRDVDIDWKSGKIAVAS